MPGITLSTTLGILILGIVSIGIGGVTTANCLIQKEFYLVLGRFSKRVYTVKITELFPLRFDYFAAMVWTLVFGPLLFLAGVFFLFVFINLMLSGS